MKTRRHARGFTLVELLVAVGLLLLLASALVLNLRGPDNDIRLTEGTTQMEGLLHYAKAQAAATGRQVRVVLGSGDSASVRVLWEPDPLTQPGEFLELPQAEQLVTQLNELVTVVVPERADGSTDPLTLTFYPDGSSDSVEIEIGTTGGLPGDRTSVISISGVTGETSHRLKDHVTDQPTSTNEHEGTTPHLSPVQ